MDRYPGEGWSFLCTSTLVVGLVPGGPRGLGWIFTQGKGADPWVRDLQWCSWNSRELFLVLYTGKGAHSWVRDLQQCHRSSRGLGLVLLPRGKVFIPA